MLGWFPAQESSWAWKSCVCPCGGGGSVCGKVSFSGYDDSTCSSSSSPGVFPVHLGSLDCEALWQGSAPGPVQCKLPESDAFPPSRVDVPDVSVPSVPALHSPGDKKKNKLLPASDSEFEIGWTQQTPESNLDSLLKAEAKQMDDPAGFFKFESAVILTEELHQSLTRHPHALYLVLCLLQMLHSHLITDIKNLVSQFSCTYSMYALWRLIQWIKLWTRAWLVCQPFDERIVYTCRNDCVCCWISASVWMSAFRATTLLFNLDKSSNTDSSHNLQGGRRHAYNNQYIKNSIEIAM